MASMNLVKILIKYAQSDREALLQEIDSIHEQLCKLDATEYIMKSKKEIQERLKKQEDRIKVRKAHKFARDKADYELG